MDAFVLTSSKFDKLDYILSSIVTNQIEEGHTWIIEPILRFITACPNIKFTLTHNACNVVLLTFKMLTAEQLKMLHSDARTNIGIGTATILHGALLELMQGVVLPSPSICVVECHRVNQAMILCDLIMQLAKDLYLDYDVRNALEQARQNVIAYRAKVIRGYDTLYPGDDPNMRPVASTAIAF